MLSALQSTQLKKTSTVVKDGFGVKATSSSAKAVLVVSRSWRTLYGWVSENVKIVLVTSKSLRKQFSFEDCKSYAEVIAFEDLNSGIVDLKIQQLHQKYNFTAIVCLGEEDLLRCARLRKLLGIQDSGQSVQSALRYRDKIIMKETIKQYLLDNPQFQTQIHIPQFSAVEDVHTIIQFTETHGYPVVIKPKTGYGSVNTTILKSPNDLEKFLETFSPELDFPLGLDIEKFIHGPMYHIDGIVHNGKLSICWPSCYLNFCGDFKEEKYNASYTLHASNPLTPRLQQFIAKVIDILGGPSFFPFHAEVWHTPEDQLVLCEIASRVGSSSLTLLS
eukprot:TRINITY_DN5398_c0_g1_i5.p1 TRINITY_DN5398_c0_g1~~TRINITY_DN5398_c0_g1_i5.p1  ORF type:complete len:332 (-),score=68.76 TRINITY_DN5398_c0_g1_i5:1131-2126(-)